MSILFCLEIVLIFRINLVKVYHIIIFSENGMAQSFRTNFVKVYPKIIHLSLPISSSFRTNFVKVYQSSGGF